MKVVQTETLFWLAGRERDSVRDFCHTLMQGFYFNQYKVQKFETISSTLL